MSRGVLDGVPDQEKPLVERSAWFRPYARAGAGSLAVQMSDTGVSCPRRGNHAGACGTLCTIFATFL